jgi:hypothetical protein
MSDRVSNRTVLFKRLDDDGDHVGGVKLRLELLPSTDLLLIPKEIHEHGEPCWNDVDREKLLIHPPKLSGNPTSEVIG